MIDPILEIRVMKRLQDLKGGQTAEELQKHLGVTQALMLTVLHKLRNEGYVTVKSGVWTMIREETGVTHE
jgi:DNA-binding IscR family transcriptional regulator